MSGPSLYERLGEDSLVAVLTRFYERAFTDPIIGHLFFGRDQEHLTRQQIDFARSFLGGPMRYRGKPLLHAHRPLPIRPPHFARRQILMAEVMEELGVAPDVSREWLEREETLRPLIMSGDLSTCRD
jgi:hemoglobin